MKDYLNTITSFISNVKKQTKEKKELQCSLRNIAEDYENVNVQEFNGKLHLSVRGVPVLPIEYLKNEVPIEEVLRSCRTTLRSHKNLQTAL